MSVTEHKDYLPGQRRSKAVFCTSLVEFTLKLQSKKVQFTVCLKCCIVPVRWNRTKLNPILHVDEA